MQIIAPSTGWMYAHKIYSLEEQEKMIRESGADGFEIVLAREQKRMDSLTSDARFGYFAHRSLHLPDYDPSRDMDQQISISKQLILSHDISTAVLHAINIPPIFIETMLSEGVPLAIENMDRQKTCGFKLEELEKLIKDFDVGFVLDVQHAYEHDEKMGYASELFDLVKYRLAHLHVSGETDSKIHALVHTAKNAEEIINFTKYILSEKRVPIVLEGEYSTSEEVKREIRFLNTELRLS